MCGIFGYIGKEPAFPFLLEGLKILQNRGYDSAGVCTLEGDQLLASKFSNDPGKINSIDKLENADGIHGRIGIAHERWATTGAKTQVNAHPHLDCDERLALVHNGIIENYSVLKKFLEEQGKTFSSQTDTEIISNLISFYLDQGYTNIRAVAKACQQLEGTWGLAIIFVDDPDHIYVSKNGSPILIGYDDDITLVSSEASAFQNYVSKYLVLKDHQVLKVGIHHERQEKVFIEKYDVKEVSKSEIIKTTPDPYPHWMLKEIVEQPISIQRSLNMGGRLQDEYQVRLGGLEREADNLLKIKHLLIVAMGTSLHAGMVAEVFFKRLKVFDSVRVMDASEFTLEDIPKPYRDVGILFLSQSGETKDVHLALELANKNDITTFAVVNMVESLIAREVSCGVYLNAGREVAVASTKSFTSQVLVLYLIGIWFAQKKDIAKQLRGQVMKQIYNLNLSINPLILKLENLICTEFVEKISQNKDLFFLGRQIGYALAKESALKVKEVAYLHAEGYPGGALKHGPFALIEEGTPIFILAFRDDAFQKMHITAEEVKSRGAVPILITDLSPEDVPDQLYDYVIDIPYTGFLAGILAIIPLQFLAYRLAIQLGHNPDFPRNLAKCVTTE